MYDANSAAAILRALETSDNFEEIGTEVLRILRTSINTVAEGYLFQMEELDTLWKDMLILSVQAGVPLVDLSIDSEYKAVRRRMYHSHQEQIATKMSQIAQVEEILRRRKAA